ncbi:MAG TPA: GNAT family N-acetyltransferase [Planctomycetota bacterium]|nr:GNAT family N-acetyltransferase [Planctomycetota bacterium]
MPRPRVLGRLLHGLSEARAGHAQRHRPTGFGFAFADRIDYLDGAHWDGLVCDATFLLSRDYLRVLEQHGPANLSVRYAIAFRGTKPVAAITVQVVEVAGARMVKAGAAAGGKAGQRREAEAAGGRVRKVLANAAQSVGVAAGKRMQLRVFACGNLLSWGPHGVALARDEDPAGLWPAVAEAIYRIRRADRLAGDADLVMVKDVPGPLVPGAGALDRFSYRRVETEPDMVLDIAPAWRRFEDYSQSLAAKYRKTVQQIERDIAAAGLRVERLADLEPHADRLHALYLQVHERAAIRPVTLSKTYLPALAAAAGPRLRATAVWRERELVGFVTSLKDGESCIGYHIGFDAATNAEAPVYFRLLQATIQDAIEWSCSRLSLGRTALEPKARLGARPQPLHVWLRHRSPAINLMLRPLLRAVHHAEAPERNPFKDAPRAGGAPPAAKEQRSPRRTKEQ